MKIKDLLEKFWFTREFGGLKVVLSKTPDSFLEKKLTYENLAGFICLLLDVTELDIKVRITQAIADPSKQKLLVYTPSPKLFSNLFLWACWACCQGDSEKAHQID